MNTLFDMGLSNALLGVGLACAVALITRCWRNSRVAWTLWLLVLVQLLVPPILRIQLPYRAWLVSSLTSEPANHGPGTGEPAFGPAETDDSAAADSNQRVVVDNATSPPTSNSAWMLLKPLVCAVWLSGAVVWTCVMAIRIVRFHRLVRRMPRGDADLQLVAASLAKQFGLRCSPEIRIVPGNLSPMLWPLGRRLTILLPGDLLARLSKDQQVTLIAHETAHASRLDHWVRWFELAVLGLYWWNPVAWWARSRLQQAEEQCCDALVVDVLPEKRREYARALFEAVEFMSAERWATAAAACGFISSSSTRERVKRIVQHQTRNRLSSRGRLALAACAAAILIAAPFSLIAEEGQDDAQPQGPSAPMNRPSQLEFSGSEYVVIPGLEYDGTFPLTIEATVTPFEQDGQAPRSSVVANLQLAGIGLHFKGNRFFFHMNDGRDENYGYASVWSNEDATLKKKVRVAAVYDGEKLSLYVDGKLQEGTAPVGEKHRASPHEFMIGADPNGEGRPHQFFKGRIDEVRISKTARYARDYEVQNELQADGDTLVLYHFNEGRGVVARDASMNHRHAVIHGAKWVEENAPVDGAGE